MGSMTRLEYAIELRYEIADNPADFIFNIHAAQNPWQTVVSESATSSAAATPAIHVDPALGSRFMRISAPPGPFRVRYEATVDIAHHFESPARIEETPIARLPPEALPFIYPSRYCQSDRLRRFATREFGHLRPGYWRVQAIRDWVGARTAFVAGVTDSSTSAADTLVEQRGVCRDFAHLMIALCRAVNIPARFVTGIDYGAAASMGPPDFHAYVEVFLGHRWYLFEPTGISPATGLVRIGTGRDAADVSFATLFGAVKSFPPAVTIEAVDDPARGFTLPRHSPEAVSTLGAYAMSQ
jgi:transglutaminase-like putative cysteine protease